MRRRGALLDQDKYDHMLGRSRAVLLLADIDKCSREMTRQVEDALVEEQPSAQLGLGEGYRDKVSKSGNFRLSINETAESSIFGKESLPLPASQRVLGKA